MINSYIISKLNWLEVKILKGDKNSKGFSFPLSNLKLPKGEKRSARLSNLKLAKLLASQELISGNSSGFPNIENWRPILEDLANVIAEFNKVEPDSPKFAECIALTQGKINRKPQASLTVDDCIAHLKAGPKNSIQFLLNKLLGKFICLDIDESCFGERILSYFWGSLKSEVPFETIFKHPLIIKTPTENHLHLYYCQPYDLGVFKESLPTWLGFKAEFVTNNIILASHQRQVLSGNFSSLSELPLNLYPYNYYAPKSFYSLKTGSPHHPERYNGLIPVGQRNEILFDFCKVENFSIEHLQTINILCCAEPLALSEIVSLANIPARKSNDATPSELFRIFTSWKANERIDYRLKDPSVQPKIQYKSLLNNKLLTTREVAFLRLQRFDPDRAWEALLCDTPLTVLRFIANFENKNDVFVDEAAWHGQGLEMVTLRCLRQLNHLDFFYVINEKAWYHWNNTFWEKHEIDWVLAIIFTKVSSILAFGGYESKLQVSMVQKVLYMLCSIANWPASHYGINFKNGILCADRNNNPKIIAHAPNYYFRSILPFEFDSTAVLNANQIWWLLDLSESRIYNINLVRFLFYNMLKPGINQIGFFIHGEPGGAKSTLTRLFKEFLGERCSTISPKSLGENKFNVLQLVYGRDMLIIPDVEPGSVSTSTVEFIKNLIGRDELVGEKKFGDALNFTSSATLIVVSNSNFESFYAFNDQAVFQWLVILPVPALLDAFRVPNVTNVINKNPSALILWALGINPEIPKRLQRAGSINQLLGGNRPIFEIQCADIFVFQSGSFKSTKELHSAFINSTQNPKNQPSTKNSLTLEKFSTRLKKTLKYLVSEQDIHPERYRQARGYWNISIWSEIQDADFSEFWFATDEKVKEILSDDPFLYNGLLLYSHEDGFKSLPLSNWFFLAQSAWRQVIDVNASALSLLMNKSKTSILPGSHLITASSSKTPLIDIDAYEKLAAINLEAVERSEINLDDKQNNSINAIVEKSSNLNNKYEENTIKTPLDNTEQKEGANPREARAHRPDNLKIKRKDKNLEINFDSLNLGPVNAYDQLTDPEFFKLILTTTLFHNTSLLQRTSEVFTDCLVGHNDWVTHFKSKYWTKIEMFHSFEWIYFERSNVSTALDEFKIYPLFGVNKLTDFLNTNLMTNFEKAWAISKNSRHRDKNDYFARNLPGSSLYIIKQQKEKLEQQYNLASENLANNLYNFKPNKRNPDWTGRSFFPQIYERGENGYARLKPLPSATLSNTKQIVKTSVLQVFKAQIGISFVELDLKSCHTVIFKALTNLTKEDRKNFPTLEDHWKVTTQQFKESAQSIDCKNLKMINNTIDPNSYEKCLSIIKNWSDDQIKGLCKNQWYKALNGGSCFKANDNLERSRNKLRFAEDQQIFMFVIIQEVFSRMPVFSILSKFQRQVNRCDLITLPTETNSFDPLTPSKKQKSSKESFQKGMTGMSRIFASCEVVLVMLIIISLTESWLNLIPIAYEADGLLLAGYFDINQKDTIINELNTIFTQHARKFLNEEFLLEFKNPI